MNSVLSYRDLIIWQKGIDLVLEVYKLSDCLPDKEKYGLCSQMQRAAVSVPANVAEGHGRDSTKEFIRHLSIAKGSLAELETHITIAAKLNFIDQEQFKTFTTSSQEIARMISGLQRSLRNKLTSP